MKSKLELLLNKEKFDPNKIFSNFKITEFAFKKANAYAQFLTKMSKQPLECYGYLLADKNDNELVTNIYLLKQEVTESDCNVLPEGKEEFHNFIKESNYTLVGWWHSHGSFDTFHSHTDENNMKNRLASTNNKKFVGKRERNLLSKNPDYILSDKDGITKLKIYNNGEKKIILELSDFSLVQNKNSKIRRLYESLNKNSFFVYSLVVNQKGKKPYCEIMFTNPDSGSSDNKVLEVKIMETEGKVIPYKEIKEDISTKIFYDGKSIAELRKSRLDELLDGRKREYENEDKNDDEGKAEELQKPPRKYLSDNGKIKKIIYETNKRVSGYQVFLKNLSKEENFHVIYNGLCGIKKDLKTKEFLINKYRAEELDDDSRSTLSSINGIYSDVQRKKNYYISHFERKIISMQRNISVINEGIKDVENKRGLTKPKKLRDFNEKLGYQKENLCKYENFKKFFEGL